MSVWQRWLRLGLACGLAVFLYFVVPVSPRLPAEAIVLRALAAAALIAVLAFGILWQVRLAMQQGLDDREARHPVLVREGADRRQPRSGAKQALVDPGRIPVDDLVDQRTIAARRQNAGRHVQRRSPVPSGPVADSRHACPRTSRNRGECHSGGAGR